MRKMIKLSIAVFCVIVFVNAQSSTKQVKPIDNPISKSVQLKLDNLNKTYKNYSNTDFLRDPCAAALRQLHRDIIDCNNGPGYNYASCMGDAVDKFDRATRDKDCFSADGGNGLGNQ